jgi:hypothetical protein
MLFESMLKADPSDDFPITFFNNQIVMLRGGVLVKQVDRLVQVVKDLYRFPLSCNVGLIGFAKDLYSRSLPYDYRLLFLLVKVCLMFDFLPIVTFKVFKGVMRFANTPSQIRNQVSRAIGNPPFLIFWHHREQQLPEVLHSNILLWLFYVVQLSRQATSGI